MSARILLLAFVVWLLSACTIKQHVLPVAVTHASGEVCIIENADVRPGFIVEFRRVLVERGYSPRMLATGAGVRDCVTVATYVARWSWDLTIYMSYARIAVFHENQQVGEAVYDATKGGGRIFDKFIDAEPKIRELVEQLFPINSGEAATAKE